eukprot:10814641-Ditylum_brightwellii.AAC.1
MASAAEAELGALFKNAKEKVALRTTLQELGHHQPATPIQVDNSVAHGIVKSNICQPKSKAIDMRFYPVKDRVKQGQFKIYWEPGRNNKADYFTKHHLPAHNKKGSNPDIEKRDGVQSTMYSSATPLAIEQARRSLRLLEPMTQG